MFTDTMSDLDYEDQSMYHCDPMMIKNEPMSDSCSEASESPIYTDLSPATFTHNLALLKQEKTAFTDDFDNLLSWTSKHPEHWTNREVLDWVYYVADVKQLDCSRLYGENYQSITGQHLCSMTRAEFTRVDATYGAVLYDLFQSMVQKSRFTEPTPPESMNPDAYPFLDTTFPCLPVPISPMCSDPSSNANSLSVVVNGSGDTAVAIGGNLYDIDVISKIDLPEDTKLAFPDDLGYVSAESDMEREVARCSSTNSPTYDVFNISDDEEMQTSPFNHFTQPLHTRKRTTPSSSSEEEIDDKTSHQRRRINSTSKGNHLWEFIRDLLKDPNLNPSLLKWEDKEAGVFKFVQSEAVANMWGRKKNNPGMTYEKLSRAMRFCRSAGYFGDVPKNGKFPKKLCFRFGPKAHDWK